MNTKELARQWFDSVWNQKDPAVMYQLMHSDAAGVSEGGEIKGPDAFRTLVYEPMVRAFPDVSVSVDRIIAEGDELALRWTFTGTHKGPFLDIPPTGKRVKFSGMTWLEFKQGKIIAGADSYNLHALIALLGGGPESASVRNHP